MYYVASKNGFLCMAEDAEFAWTPDVRVAMQFDTFADADLCCKQVLPRSYYAILCPAMEK